VRDRACDVDRVLVAMLSADRGAVNAAAIIIVPVIIFEGSHACGAGRF